MLFFSGFVGQARSHCKYCHTPRNWAQMHKLLAPMPGSGGEADPHAHLGIALGDALTTPNGHPYRPAQDEDDVR